MTRIIKKQLLFWSCTFLLILAFLIVKKPFVVSADDEQQAPTGSLEFRKETTDDVHGEFYFMIKAWAEKKGYDGLFPTVDYYTEPYLGTKWLDQVSYQTTPINTSQSSSITVNTKDDEGNILPDVDVDLYRIASLDQEGRADPYSDFQYIHPDNVLKSSVWYGNIEADAHQSSDAATGPAVFDNLVPGVYYVMPRNPVRVWDSETGNDIMHWYSDTIITLPQENNGALEYDVTVDLAHTAKVRTYEDTERTITLEWEDEGEEQWRPSYLGVSLLYNGHVHNYYELNEGNNWTITVTGLSSDEDWQWYTDIPHDHPDGYRGSWITKDGTTTLRLRPGDEPFYEYPVEVETIKEYLDLTQYAGSYIEPTGRDHEYWFRLWISQNSTSDHIYFSDLPVGTQYEIREFALPDGVSALEPASGLLTGSISEGDNTALIRNGATTQANTKPVSLTKYWEDMDDRYGYRPDSIEVELLASNHVTHRHTFTAEEIEGAIRQKEEQGGDPFCVVPLPEDIAEKLEEPYKRPGEGEPWFDPIKLRPFLNSYESYYDEREESYRGLNMGNVWIARDPDSGKFAMVIYYNVMDISESWKSELRDLIGKELKIVDDRDVVTYNSPDTVNKDDPNNQWEYIYRIRNDEEVLQIKEKIPANYGEVDTYRTADMVAADEQYEVTNTLMRKTVYVRKQTLTSDKTTKFDFTIDFWEVVNGERLPYEPERLPAGVTGSGGHYELSLAGNESKAFNQLPVGIEYETTEKPKEGWVMYASESTSGKAIYDDVSPSATYYNMPENLIHVRKIWDDSNDMAHQRPASLDLNLIKAEPKTDGEAYVEYDDTTKTLTFFRDTPGKYTNKQVIGTKTYFTGVESTGSTEASVPWVGANVNRTTERVKRVVIRDVMRPVNTSYWFAYISGPSRYEGLENLDTSRVTAMRYMFGGRYYRTGGGNTFHMSYPFVKELDLTHFDTSNVTDMRNMFYNNPYLEHIYVSDTWDTSQVTESGNMFGYQRYNTYGDPDGPTMHLPNFDRSVTDVRNAHYGEGGYLTYMEPSQMSFDFTLEGVTKNNDNTWLYEYSAPIGAGAAGVEEPNVPAYYEMTGVEKNEDTGEWEVTNYFDAEKTLTVTKRVIGNMADPDKKFSFVLTALSLKGKTLRDSEGEDVAFDADGRHSFELANGESLSIVNMPFNTVYSIKEEDYSAEGYTTTLDGAQASSATALVIQEDTTHVFANTKSAPVPTGIRIRQMKPWLLACLFVAGVAVIWAIWRKIKKRKERRTFV